MQGATVDGNFGGSSGNTYYCPLSSCEITNSSTTADRARTYMGKDGVYESIRIYVGTNNMDDDTIVTVVIDGSDTDLTLTIPAGTTGTFTTYGPRVGIRAGSYSYLKIDTTASTLGTLNFYSFFVEFRASRYTACTLGSFDGSGASHGGGASRYVSFGGTMNFNGNEDQVQTEMNTNVEASYFSIYMIANTKTTVTTCYVNKNGSNTALTFTIPIATSGWFFDTSNTVSLVDGDLINVEVSPGGVSGSLTCGNTNICLETVDHISTIVANKIANYNTSNTYYDYGWGVINRNTNESNRQTEMYQKSILSNFRTYVSSNGTTTGPCTIDVRKNGADGNQGISISAGATGEFVDTSNIDSYDPGDLLSLQIDNTSGDANVEVSVHQFKVETRGALRPKVRHT